ncbi:MAG: hypothetical protein NWS64_00265, partial [Microbacteriaceae bacterium]|nr:hypothetical protein [Microbacteriaceae bacterium]
SKLVGLSLALGLSLVALTSTSASALVPNPSGTLLGRVDATIPANPIANGNTFTNADVDGYISAETVEWNKAFSSDDSCRLAWESGANGPTPGSDLIPDNTENHPFVTRTIEVLVAGEYTFRVVSSAGIEDPYLALFGASGFDKLNPDTGIIGCNDDGGYDGQNYDDNGVDNYDYPSSNQLWSEFTVDLTPGSHTLVMASYSFYVNDADWYAGNNYTSYVGPIFVSYPNGDSGSGSVSTATWEFWGPAGGIDAPIEGGGSSQSESLAPTGGSDLAANGALLLGIAAVIGAVVVRRRTALK